MTTMNTRGQLTVAIVIGLIIIILAGVIFFMQRSAVQKELEAGVRRITVQPEAQPMQDYISECLEKTTSEGIMILASQGGWITPPGRVNKAQPTQGDAVPLSPTSDQHIPYWYYLDSPNDCTGVCNFAGLQPLLKKPSQDSMEAQLDEYATRHIKECLGDFAPFSNQGYTISEAGPLKVSTTILPKTVTVYATIPFTFTKPGSSVSTSEVFASIPAKLGELYRLADDITRLEREHRFLERHLRQLIDLQSGTSGQSLPPISEVDIQFSSGTTWVKSEVKARLMNLLATYTPFLQVFGTESYRPIIAPPRHPDPVGFDRLYNRNMLVLTSTETGYPDLEARFAYLPWWEPYFDLNCQGELCRPEVLLNTMGIRLGIQRYLFSYDMSYPVLVELKDPEAFQGRGLTFDFMLEANMRNNEPLPGAFNPVVAEQGSGTSLFCDPAQFLGTNLTLTVTDGKTKQGVPGADLLYTCGEGSHPNASSCFITKTTTEGKATTKLPVCVGGTIQILKDGYALAALPFDSDIPGKKTLSATIEPIRVVNIDVKRLRLIKSPTGWRLEDEPVGLDSREEATFSLHRHARPFEEEFTTAGNQIGDITEDATSGNHRGIGLIPGTYTVDLFTTLSPDPALVIPIQHRCTEGQCVDIPKDPVVFDSTKPLLYGGAKYDVEVTAHDLDTHATLTLYAIDAALDLIPEADRVIEDLEPGGDIEKLSQAYNKQIRPGWG